MRLLVDAGPLVAFFNEKDQWHSWAVETSTTLAGPLVTCEAVLTETFFLLRHTPKGCQEFIEALAEPQNFLLPWSFENNREAVMNLYRKYRDVPASFADMCLLQMASTMKDPLVWTTDHHFQIYRLPGKGKIPTITPHLISR